jgi:hypothetical protein
VLFTAEGNQICRGEIRLIWRRIELYDATVAFCGIKSTCQELEERMDELARKYVETDEKEIVEELYRLARELEKMEKKSLD